MTLIGRYEREKRREMLEKSVVRRPMGGPTAALRHGLGPGDVAFET